jgi:hypothetical protein
LDLASGSRFNRPSIITLTDTASGEQRAASSNKMGGFNKHFRRWFWCLIAVVPPISCAAQSNTPPGQTRSRISPCKAGQLSATEEPEAISAGLGHLAITIAIRNRTSSPCFVEGVPTVVFADRVNQPLRVHVCSNCPDYLFAAQPVQQIVLRRDQSAYVVLGYTDMQENEGCRQTVTLSLQLGIDRRMLKVRVNGMRTSGVVDVTPLLDKPPESGSISAQTH